MTETPAPAGRSVALRAGWLTALAIAAVLAVNVAGLVGIALARRDAREARHRAFQVETAGRAHAIEAALASARADLAFLAGSSPVARLGEAGGSAEAAWRTGAENALLLFLRSHPEVVRIVVRSARGVPLVHTGRRGGIPVLWVSADPTGLEGAAVAPDRPRVAAQLELPAEAGGGLRIETEVEPLSLLSPPRGEPQVAASLCVLLDARGRVLARHPPGRPAAAGDLAAEAALSPEAWSTDVPWRLRCVPPTEAGLGAAEPVASRFRTTLALNLVVMLLALLLGGFAVQQIRRRERLEAAAREEARVRGLERQLFHAERLTTVGRLAAGIAHEINNPLEGMANYLTLAKDALARGDAAAVERHLASVKQGLDRAASVVRQVLAHADPAKAPLEPCDLNQILRETGRFIESRQEFKDIAFALELTEEPLVVRGSPAMLGQVALNLVLNACEAQPRGGEVRIRSRRENGAAVAEFVDRGPGVAESDRERIFEPFYSTKDTTGLGLSVCHSIVRNCNGDLSVHSREGGGALFRLRLPALEA